MKDPCIEGGGFGVKGLGFRVLGIRVQSSGGSGIIVGGVDIPLGFRV